MKRLRHYTNGNAIVLSCFGSVNKIERYLKLQANIQDVFPNLEVKLAISSKTVLKKLASIGQEYLSLPAILANLDQQGFLNIIVVPVYLFPTDEYQYAAKIVAGFKSFSGSNIEITPALFHTTKDANKILAALSDRFKAKADSINLFICHGAPLLNEPGHQAIGYMQSMLQDFSKNNFVYSLEGAWPFSHAKASFIAKNTNNKKIKIIPLLLVSGNHFEHDINEIRADLEQDFVVKIAKPIRGDSYCLLDESVVTDIIFNHINYALTKLNIVIEQ